MKKRILSLLLAIITVAALALPVSAKTYKFNVWDSAQEKNVSYSCDWSYNSKTKTLTLSGTMPGADTPWESYQNKIQTIVLKSQFKALPWYVTDSDWEAENGDVFGRNYPNLKEFKVESGNKQYKAKDGVLYNAKMTELLIYPKGKTSKTYTLPKTVKAVHGRVSQNVTTIKVESGNKYFTAKDGVLYDKKITELVLYPLGKKQLVYTVPKTVKKLDLDKICRGGDGDSLFTVAVVKSAKTETSTSNIMFAPLTVLTNTELTNSTPGKVTKASGNLEEGSLVVSCERDWDAPWNAAGVVLYEYNAASKKYEMIQAQGGEFQEYITTKVPTKKTKYAVAAFTVQKDGLVKYSKKTTFTYDPKK